MYGSIFFKIFSFLSTFAWLYQSEQILAKQKANFIKKEKLTSWKWKPTNMPCWFENKGKDYNV